MTERLFLDIECCHVWSGETDFSDIEMRVLTLMGMHCGGFVVLDSMIEKARQPLHCLPTRTLTVTCDLADYATPDIPPEKPHLKFIEREIRGFRRNRKGR